MHYPQQINIDYGKPEPYTMGKSLRGDYYIHSVNGGEKPQANANEFINFLKNKQITHNVTYSTATLGSYLENASDPEEN